MTHNFSPRSVLSGLAAVAALVACDSTATIYISTLKYQQTQIISAYPAKKQADGSWERVCGQGPVDGIITNVAYLSSLRRSGSSGAPDDLDVSIRPTDVIDAREVYGTDGGRPREINLASTGNVQLQLDCINPTSTPGNECNTGAGAATPSATLDAIRYVANTTTRQGDHNVMLLVDQSGSVGGLVRDRVRQCADGKTCNNDTDCNGICDGRCVDRPESEWFKEERSPNPLPSNFGDVASDRSGLRLSAARRLLGILNEDDDFGALAFGEGITLSVPCSDAIQDVQADLETCFGKPNRDIWATGIDDLQVKTGGRSNMWDAVETAYTFLRAKNDRQRSNHIIVLTDGPDTCAGENRLTCTAPCTTADYAELVDRLDNDANDPNAAPIRIHFVQFEALGYPGRDPRQVEVSCLTGGHYQFLNSNSFSRTQTDAFREAFDTAVANVRYVLMGHWELAASVPTYASNAGGGAGVPPGRLYGLQGALTLRQTSNMVSKDELITFGVGQGMGAPSATNWDRRPTIRKPCGGFADCGAAAGPGACETICSPETLVCANGASAVALPDLAACDGGGTAGFCCSGACQTGGGQCAACVPLDPTDPCPN